MVSRPVERAVHETYLMLKAIAALRRCGSERNPVPQLDCVLFWVDVPPLNPPILDADDGSAARA
jgi:hypothetical protein